jgi:thiol-disulfide isomerase/thioredoxin
LITDIFLIAVKTTVIMKKAVLYSLTISVLLFACAEDRDSTISGELKNAANRKVTLEKVTEDGEVVLDSAVTDDAGKFTLKNPVSETDYYLLRSGPESVIFLILSGGENISITGDALSMDTTYRITGSTESSIIQQLRYTERRLTDSLNAVFASMRYEAPSERDSLGHLLETHYSTFMADFSRRLVNDNLSALASLSATKFLEQSGDLKLMRALADSLTLKFSGNRYVEDYTALVTDLEKLPPGSEAPPIVLQSIEGKKLSLADYKGKIVLVDFWASWCQPCRRANPDLVRLYKKYQSDRVEFIGVSLDDNMDSWKRAVKNDGLTWPQVSELKKWDSRCVEDYKISAIPYSILLDEEGKIVAKGLSPEDLELKIQELLRKKS